MVLHTKVAQKGGCVVGRRAAGTCQKQKASLGYCEQIPLCFVSRLSYPTALHTHLTALATLQS